MIRDPENKIKKTILSQIKNKNCFALDIGCGNGEVTKFISKNTSLTIGIEPFFEKLKNLKTDNLYFAANSGSSLCFKDQSFDFVFFCQSLHHIEENSQALALKEAERVLKNKGTLLIIEPMYNKGIYGKITALINTEKRLKEKANKEIKKLKNLSFKKLFSKNLKIEFLINGYNDFFNSKIKDKPGINWNESIEAKIKNLISQAPEKHGKLSIDNHLNVFCFQKD
ncbi:MAG: class I SAM-dependent methyltransferase [Desulforegulaceae bacterium]|nr:class I SAM-dependent methyltransferase [Desulforegulaceae bacterium]